MHQHKKFKYNINSLISQLDRGVTVQSLKKILEKDHSISRSTFDRDRNILLNSDKSIPTDRLDAYAVLFRVSAEELKNYTIKGRSIYESHNIDDIKTGLS